MNNRSISYIDTPFKRLYRQSKLDRAILNLRIECYWEIYCYSEEA